MKKGEDGSTYTRATKDRIVRLIVTCPGLKGSEIAHQLGLDTSRVNSFLHREGKWLNLVQDTSYRWSRASAYAKPAPARVVPFVQPAVQESATPRRSVSTVCEAIESIAERRGQKEALQVIAGMSAQKIEQAFGEDTYAVLNDDFRAAMADRLDSLRADVGLLPLRQRPVKRNRTVWAAAGLLCFMVAIKAPPQMVAATAVAGVVAMRPWN